jgi:hypothetical protein
LFNINLELIVLFYKIRLLDPSTYLLIGFYKFNQYSWVLFSLTPFKFFKKFKHTSLIEFNFFKKKVFNKRLNLISNHILLKKKISILKKKDKAKYLLLMRLNFFKNKYKSAILKSRRKKNLFFKLNKFVELRRRLYKYFNNNRNMLKSVLGLKQSRQYRLTKLFQKNLKDHTFNSLLKFEMSITNILLLSKFIFSKKGSDFLIKNGFLCVNNRIVRKNNFILSSFDIISLPLNSNFFFFYKHFFNKNLKLTYKVGYRLWRLNFLKFNFFKQSSTRIPDWIFKIIYFYDDIPKFLEVDFIIMSIFIVKLPKSLHQYSFYYLQSISFFLLRHYNWKRVV